MDADQPPKPRAAARKLKPGSTGPTPRVSLNLRLDPADKVRLQLHATMTGRDDSAVVRDLIRAHLRRFVVQDRGESAPPPEGQGSDGAGSR